MVVSVVSVTIGLSVVSGTIVVSAVVCAAKNFKSMIKRRSHFDLLTETEVSREL